MSALMAAVGGTHVRELAREAVGSQPFRPELRSENPLRGWCLVQWPN